MCGISGILSKNKNQSQGAILRMLEVQKHRGPDAQGVWQNDFCTLGHNRLAIIDLHDAANQPMHSQNGRYTIVFNGEIYNYKAIKAELQNDVKHWNTDSDTEVLLEAYSKWGLDCLPKLNGMFAFAIWDNKEGSLLLVRDRLGIKPLYFHCNEHILVFASELRTVLKSGMVEKKVNVQSVNDFLRYQWIQSPETIIEGIKTLEAGSYAIYQNGTLSKKVWWDINSFQYTKNSQTVSESEAKHTIKDLFYTAVERRLVSDVPIGAFLSGGIDSSAVVAAMAHTSASKVNTFNIGFKEKKYDESEYAKAIAQKFNTEHHTLIYSAENIKNEIPEILDSFDTPSTDGVNSYVISSLVKKAGITVALSGLGGDELFCGYPVFNQLPALKKFHWFWKLPKSVRTSLSKTALLVGDTKWDKLGALLATESASNVDLYPFFRQIYSKEASESIVKGIHQESSIKKMLKSISDDHLLGWISHAEIAGYTQHVLLKDSDMCSMTHALEIRVPFFDFKLVEYVLSLTDNLKRPTSPKQLLTESLDGILPMDIINRPKMGFSFPWDEWIRNDLKKYVSDVLTHAKNYDFLNETEIDASWNRFLSGDKRVKWYHIWNLVCIINWLKTNLE